MSLLKAAVGNAYEWICESGEWPANWLNLAKGQFVYLNFSLFAFLKMNSGSSVRLDDFDLWFLFIQERRELLDITVFVQPPSS